MPTWSLDGGLYVGEVTFVDVDLDALGRVLRQLHHLLGHLPDHLRREVLH